MNKRNLVKFWQPIHYVVPVMALLIIITFPVSIPILTVVAKVWIAPNYTWRYCFRGVVDDVLMAVRYNPFKQ